MSKFSLKRFLDKEAPILIILGRPITLLYFEKLWNSAAIRICADGGCQALYNYSKDLIPDYIIGDMDSADQTIIDYYQERLLPDRIVIDKSQDENDLVKCCKYAIDNKLLVPDMKEKFLVVGGQGGPRWDHSYGSIHCCCMWPDIKIILFEEQCVCFIIPPGEDHEIEIDLHLEGPGCGIFPIEGATKVTTGGLKWNLINEPIEMGKRVSLANAIQSQIIYLSTDRNILWIEQINPLHLI
jgi:thiamine pyrophosphokinase